MFSKFIKKNWGLLIGPLILFLVVFVNIFPRGYVFGGGDTIQLIEAKNNFRSLFYEWQGRGSFFYSIFYLLDILGISDTGQLSWYLGIFIFGSYFSFYAFSKMVFRSHSIISFLVSLFYALNLYTLLIFTINWGFSHFQSLYIFLPLIFGFYIKFLVTKKYSHGFLFCFSLLLASSGFGNPAFALSLFIVLLVLAIFMMIFKIIKLEKNLFFKLITVSTLALLVNSYWILPIIPIMKTGVETVYSSKILDLNWWIVHTSVPIFQMLRLLNNSNDYFPENFPYPKFLILKNIFIFLSYLPSMFIIFTFIKIRKNDEKHKQYFFAFLGTLVVLFMLVSRVREPFEAINYLLFNLWGMNTLRSYEKFAIYLPFFFSVLFLLSMIRFKKRQFVYFVIFLILITPLPFYLGKIQQNLSYRFSSAKPENKDYKKSGLSFLVKIPEDYYRIRNTINSDPNKYFIAALPATPNDGSWIERYPKWKFYGMDITEYLYNKKFINANRASYYAGWNFTKEFNENYSGNYDWIINLLGIMNSKYIIYHKDAPYDQIKQSLFKMDILEQQKIIKKIDENDFFNLYEIDSMYRVPYISWQKKSYNLSQNLNFIKNETEEIRKITEGVKFQELNPKKYLVKIENNLPAILVLSEKYDKNWKAYYIYKNSQKKEIISHHIERGYANGWKVENDPQIKQILIEYYPVRLMWYGIYISAATALFLIVYLLRCYYVQKTYKKNFS